METWITTMMEDFGYLGVFLLIMLENLFPPIPSEVILTFGGYMTSKTDLTVMGVIIASTLGSVAGAIILYGIGAIVGIQRIERFVDKWGKILRLTSRDIHKANAWFEKYDVWTVFFCWSCQNELLDFLIADNARNANLEYGTRKCRSGSWRVLGDDCWIHGHLLKLRLCSDSTNLYSGCYSIL